MIKYIIGFALMLVTVTALSGESMGIVIKDGVVTMPLRTFREIITYVKNSQEQMKALQEQLDEANTNADKIEDCVRANVANHELVLKCFGDVEG